MQLPSYGTATVKNSITNPDAAQKTWIDLSAPLSFFDFLKNTSASASPKQFNDSYNKYLRDWYNIKGTSAADALESIKNQYINLLKEISLNFTTYEEKRFLSNIDYSNDQDLAIAIPFFSSKIVDICKFYTNKREKIKYRIDKNKIKGTIPSVDQKIFDIITDYILIDDRDDTYNVSNIALSAITSNLNIEIEELYDIYSEYLNIDSDQPYDQYEESSDLRKELFSHNSNYLDVDLFVDFDSALKRAIFDKPIVIEGLETAFFINYSPDFADLVCSPENPLDEYIKSGLESTSPKLILKKKLLEKYIGTDIYYLSTNSTGTDYVSGVLFTAESPSKNLLNQRFPGTASVPSNKLKSPRDIGLFFKPDKLGVLFFKTSYSGYKINSEAIEPNKIYVFPDPEIYGNVSNISTESYEYPLLFVIDNTPYVKNGSYGFAIGDIYSTPYDQLMYSYISRQDLESSTQSNSIHLPQNFISLYNAGVITEWKSDIYGNEYGLLKNTHTNKRAISSINDAFNTTNSVNYIVLDGYLFSDINTPGFDYSISTGFADDGSSLRTGVSARTINASPPGWGSLSTGYTFASGDGMFILSGSPIYNLYFREFYPYIDCIYPNSIGSLRILGKIYDCVSFTLPSDVLLDDPTAADDILFNSTYPYIDAYYNVLVEAGIVPDNPTEPAPLNTASFFGELDYTDDNTMILDGSSFLVDIGITNDYPFVNTQQSYYVQPPQHSRTVFDANTGEYINQALSDIRSLTGTIFVRNISSSSVTPISAAMGVVINRHLSAIRDSIYTNVEWFDVIYDSIFIKAGDYLLIEKISYADGVFNLAPTPGIVITVNSSPYNSISKPLFIESNNHIYIAELTVLSAASAVNSRAIYPKLYQYDMNAHDISEIYSSTLPQSTINLTYTLSGLGDVNILRVSQPELVYNSRNNIFSLTYSGEDGNAATYIFNSKFTNYNNTIEALSATAYKLSIDGISYNFNESSLNTSLISGGWLSGGGIYHSSEAGIIEF
jgi:hypothetical protein